jgi:hypothetical protein
VLTTIDRDELARACDLYTEANKLWAIYKEQPRVTHSIRGQEIKHCTASPTLGNSSITFGIGSPAERSRLKVTPQDTKKSKWSGLLQTNN